MESKMNLILLFGGASAEHEISLRSAQTIYKHFDHHKYNIFAVGINKKGFWFLQQDEHYFDHVPSQINESLSVYLTLKQDKAALYSADDQLIAAIDAVFPIIHGPSGEDGSLQGFLTTLKTPYVGPGVLSSASCMDKEVAKILLQDKGLNVAPGLAIHNYNRQDHNYHDISRHLGAVLYIKPANMGSSVGVSKVINREEFDTALDHAFKFDHKVIVEQAIEGREIECAVLGNEKVKASCIGEIMPKSFYTYEAKYADDSDADLEIPANLSADQVKNIQKIAKTAYQALNCEGMSRIDMFLQPNGNIIINEANTLPGFTSISMYPSLWKESGIKLPELLDNLIELALERHQRDQNIQKSYS